MYEGFSSHIAIDEQAVEFFFLPKVTSAGMAFMVFSERTEAITIYPPDNEQRLWHFTENLTGRLSGFEPVLVAVIEKALQR